MHNLASNSHVMFLVLSFGLFKALLLKKGICLYKLVYQWPWKLTWKLKTLLLCTYRLLLCWDFAATNTCTKGKILFSRCKFERWSCLCKGFYLLAYILVSVLWKDSLILQNHSFRSQYCKCYVMKVTVRIERWRKKNYLAYTRLHVGYRVVCYNLKRNSCLSTCGGTSALKQHTVFCRMDTLISDDLKDRKYSTDEV